MSILKVEIAYCLSQQQTLLAIELSEPCTIQEALAQSTLLDQHSELKLEQLDVGIFSKPATMDTLLRDGDRIELYRPLVIDPKQARRRRAELKAKRLTGKSPH